jgi:outer membrane protein assembly factor BamB
MVCRRHYLAYSLFCVLGLVLAACSRDQSAGSSLPTATADLGTNQPTFTATATRTRSTLPWDDWLTYHRDNTRSGYSPQTPDPQKLTAAWRVQLDGAVYAQPLMVKGDLIAVTEQNSLYALDPSTGKLLWHMNVGTPVARSTLQCGDIDPLGITGTPVYDPATNLIFAVAEVEGPQHVLVGVDETTGQIRQRRVVDVSGMDAGVYQQRAALALSHNTVYIAYGGLAGDCGDYIGTVVAAPTNGQGNLLSYRVPTTREAGIWAPSGPAIDRAGNVFVAVGNGEATSGNWDHSDSVLRLSPTLQLEDAFAPRNWGEENATDADLGSTGPLLLSNGFIFAAGKTGDGYILRANALGGVGGQVSTTKVCNGSGSYGGAAAVASYVLVPCSNGVTRITVNGQGQMSIDWHASQITLPPTIGGHTVYGLDGNGTLYAADLNSGGVRTQVDIGDSVPHFASPMISNHSLFMGTMHGIASVTIS